MAFAPSSRQLQQHVDSGHRITRQAGSRHLPTLADQSVYIPLSCRYIIAFLAVFSPVVFTAWSFIIIGIGVKPPEENSSGFNHFIYNQRNTFTGVNASTNVIFTLLFAYSIYLKLIKKENYTRGKLLLAFCAAIPGSVSAANFYPLLENARETAAEEHGLSETTNQTMQIANFGGVGGGAYINTIACYGILQLCIALINNIREHGLRHTVKQAFNDPLNRCAVPLAFALGIFYWVQVSRYVADFFRLSLAASLSLCTGDFFFGNFYLYFGLYQILNGFAHLTHRDAETSKCTALTLNLVLLGLGLAWDAFNIIPTYTQGTDFIGQIGLIVIAMILNFYASNRVANAFTDLVALNPRNAARSLYAPPKDADNPDGAEPSFNTTLPLASLRTGLTRLRAERHAARAAAGMTTNPMLLVGASARPVGRSPKMGDSLSHSKP